MADFLDQITKAKAPVKRERNPNEVSVLTHETKGKNGTFFKGSNDDIEIYLNVIEGKKNKNGGTMIGVTIKPKTQD